VDLIETQTKQLVKDAVTLMYLKDYEAAEHALQLALGNTQDFGEATSAAEYLPRIYHRMAQLEALRGNWEMASRLFERAESTFMPSNAVGRAKTLLTWAKLAYFKKGDEETARKLVRQARKILQRTNRTNPTWQKEYFVTKGFEDQIDDSMSVPEQVERLQVLDETLKGGSDPIYERENLAALMALVPLPQKLGYLLRYEAIGYRLVANYELNRILRDAIDGNIRGVMFGTSGRTVKRLLRR
jgi:tetratricopeptide (TPR) repeat protein